MSGEKSESRRRVAYRVAASHLVDEQVDRLVRRPVDVERVRRGLGQQFPDGGPCLVRPVVPLDRPPHEASPFSCHQDLPPGSRGVTRATVTAVAAPGRWNRHLQKLPSSAAWVATSVGNPACSANAARTQATTRVTCCPSPSPTGTGCTLRTARRRRITTSAGAG
ncbi:MAG: hypothetical protein ACRDIB_03490 [Ardenticatenaceae bacterium]